jgi:hypothetical protein
MYEWYYVGSYWEHRQESAGECGRRAALFFQMLSRCDPTFAQWYRGGQGIPRGLPGHPVRSEAKEWEQLFLKGMHRSDVDNALMEELGFQAHVWNAKRERTRVEIRCGGYSPGVRNSCLLRPPEEGSVRDRLLRAPVLAELLTCVATAWEPDFAIVSSSEMVELVQKRKWEVRVGWLTYLSRRLGQVPPLPAPVRIEPVGELGWLLILSPEVMSANNPEHVAFTARVRELLDRAHLIDRSGEQAV